MGEKVFLETCYGLNSMIRFYIFLCLSILLLTSPLNAEESLPEDLTEIPIEALMRIEVTSVSKKTEKLSDAAAAVFVITQEDIQRSSAANIPDLLRIVPGLQVTKIDANKWAISSRGFNGRFANKLLVLMDGRSLYSPLFSGVFWDAQDTVLEDIERIEIIRGPGATLWGANAVNGVINIITKHSGETQGGLVTGGGGTEERGFASVRYGGSTSDQTHYRIYAKYFDRAANVDAAGNDTADQWHQGRSGFRVDHKSENKDLLTFQGDIHQGRSGETATYPDRQADPPYFASVTEDHENELFGGNLLGRWSRTISETSDLALQSYYDHSVNNFTVMDCTVDTFDIDFQHRFQPVSRNSVIWGLGYRYIHDNSEGIYSTYLDPESLDYDLISAFVQDDITLIPERWRLTFGTKFENNDFSGTEWQPSARIIWTPDTPSNPQSIWAAVSRAVRTPSRGETANRVKMLIRDDNIPPFLAENFLTDTIGNPDFDSEEVLTYELGYRFQPMPNLSFDVATHYNSYEKLRIGRIGEPVYNPPPEPSVLPITVENNLEGKSYGVEAVMDYRPINSWRLQLAYTYLELDLKSNIQTTDFLAKFDEGSIPKHQSSLRSFWDLNDQWQLDFWLRYVSELPAIDFDGYVELDARLNWRIRSDMDVSLIGQNLLDSHHPEQIAEYLDTKPTEIQRAVYGKVTLRF